MTYQLPIVPQLLTTQAVAPTELLRIQALQAITQSLEVGTLLQLKVQLDQAGNPTVLLKGQRFPASLPPGIANGQEIAARVLSNTDSLVLQIINQDPAKLPTTPTVKSEKSLVFQLIEKVFGEGAIKNLQETKELLVQQLPLVLEAPEHKVQSEELQVETPDVDALFNKVLPKKQSETSLLLDKLGEKHQILTKTQLQDPKDLFDALPKLLFTKAPEVLPQIQTVIKQVQQQREHASQAEFTKSLAQHIEQLLAQTPDLSASPKNESEQTTQSSQQLKLYTASSLLLIEHSNARGLEQLSRNIRNVDLKDSPLTFLIKTLSLIDIDLQNSQETTPTTQEFIQSVKSFLNELKALRDIKAPDKDLRAVLQKFVERLHTQKASATQISESFSPLDQATQALRNLETSIASKENLSAVNSLLYSLGQPALFLIPALIDGSLFNWKVTLHNPKQVSDQESSEHKSNQQGYEKVEFDIALPGLGAINVLMAKKEDEVLLQLGLGCEEAREFVASKLPALEQRIKDSGADKVEATARISAKISPIPVWYEELVKRSIIA